MKTSITCSLALAALLPLMHLNAQAEETYSLKDSVSFFIKSGKSDLEARRYSTAWSSFEKAAKLDPKNIEAQTGIMNACLKMNRMAPAIRAMETVIQLTPSDYATQWKLAQLYFNYGQYDKVLEMVPDLRTKVTDAKGWAFMLGKAYQSKEQFGKAITYLQQAMKDEPANSEAPYLIGRMYVQMENYKAAISFYKNSLERDSTSQPNRVYELALVLATANQFEESISYFKMALDKGFKARDDFYMNMANTLADAHKTDEAIKMMEEMLSRRPGDIGLLNGLADVCYHSGRYKEAISYWDQLLAGDDKNARALYQIGLAYIKMGKDKDGQQLCDRAIAMDPALAVLKHAKQMPM
ncbi:MAG: tetratricopeptide repeat protein [Bacteroidetes bacterium]|nr:tetratricopeptide repeat protein [Bacteroidota bacterium]MBS1630248.1 tetratricopeptide repeat protein [Bacteroidota bacterium]